MWDLIKSFWFDRIVAKMVFLGLLSLAAAFFNTPKNRPWYERLIGAAAISVPIAGASLSLSGRHVEQLNDLNNLMTTPKE